MEPRILITGDRAISVQMGNEISLEVNQKVLALQNELAEHPIEGITEMVPTYASLMIHYRPEKIRAKALMEEVTNRFGKLKDTEKKEFNWKVLGAASFVVFTAVGIGTAALGGKFDFKLPKKN